MHEISLTPSIIYVQADVYFSNKLKRTCFELTFALYSWSQLRRHDTNNVVLTFEPVDEISMCDHSNETFLAVLSHDSIDN